MRDLMAADTTSTVRLTRPEILSRLREARASGSLPPGMDALATPIAILSGERQVIYANNAFRELTGSKTIEQLCGGRPGEVLGCVNAGAGCGDAEDCRFCGARHAIVETLRTGVPHGGECHITVDASDRGPAFDFEVQGVPFEIGGRAYVMLSLTDISHQKRRAALERIFFHDILNTASSFRVYLDLLGRGALDGESRAYIERLSLICDTLEEEVESQRVILSAETGTLHAQRQLISTGPLVTQLVQQAAGWEIAKDRSLRVAAFSESFTIISDDSLMKRILGNMLKNALEASPNGAVVTVGYRRDQPGRALFHVHNPSFIEPSVQERIFHRYFSTKGDGRGLGTWGMRLLAEDYLGGSVTFTSTQEGGTTFLLDLPLKPADL
jgi:signal transduction histidine kinase